MTSLFISDEDADGRLNSDQNLNVVHREQNKHKKVHDKGPNLDNELRSIIGTYAAMTTQKQAGELFGVTQAAAHNYEHGRTHSNTREQDPDLKTKLEDKRGIANDKAMNILLGTLDVITPDKVKDLKVKEAAGIAKDISGIIKNIAPQEKQTNVIGQVIFISPKTSIEEEYDIVDAVPVDEIESKD